MTISELGSIGELIGAAATVATLLYLALQIRASNLAAKRQSLNDIRDRLIQWHARLVGSPDLFRSWVDGTKSYHNLQIEEQVKFALLAGEIFSACEPTIDAGKSGGIKQESVEGAKEIIYQLLRNKGIREYWEVCGCKVLAADFVEEVNLILKAAEKDSSEVCRFSE